MSNYSLPINDYSCSNNNNNKMMTFSQTCNRLSQFVKDKRVFRIPPTNLDAPRGVGEGYNGATMNLFLLKQVEDSTNGSIGRTINLFPQISSVFDASVKKQANPESSAPQMTIFYGGQVVVFNDIPADKAKEVLNMASRFESSLKKRKIETPPPTSIMVPNSKPISANTTPLTLVPTTDMPIARKASLHRFLEKRKDRLVGNAPGVGATKPLEGKPWLGLNSIPVIQQKHQQL